MSEDMSLIVELKNRQRVELADYARGMFAIHNEYRRYVCRHHPEVAEDDIRLYVDEIRPGSIITELIAYAPYVLPLLEQAGTVQKYAEHLAGLFKWLLGSAPEPKEEVSRQTLQGVHDMLEPVAKDPGSSVNLVIKSNHGTINVITASQVEANAIQNRARRELERRTEPVHDHFEQVLMYWDRASNTQSNSKTDRARIDAIQDKPVAVAFANADLKNQLLFEPERPFAKAFLVDVEVQTVRGEPRLYKVTRLHDVIDLD